MYTKICDKSCRLKCATNLVNCALCKVKEIRLLYFKKFFCYIYVNSFILALEVRNWTPEYYVANQSDCQQILEGPDVLMEIPLLNNTQLHNIRDKALVRFRGMIQDMYNPEYYFKQYEVKNTDTGESDVRCGMYMDAARCLVYYLHFLIFLPSILETILSDSANVIPAVI